MADIKVSSLSLFSAHFALFPLISPVLFKSKIKSKLHRKRFRLPDFSLNCTASRTVSEYCSDRVSHVGLSTKQATEPYSDNLLNRTRNPSEPCSDKDIPLRRALRRMLY